MAHLASDHGAAQLIQGLGWAITDAEDTQPGGTDAVADDPT